MSNRERKAEFLDTYDAANEFTDSFDGDFSRLDSVSLTSSQVELVNRILLKEKLRYTAVWLIYSILLVILLLYGNNNFRNPLQKAFVILLLSVSYIMLTFGMARKWRQEKCREDSKAYQCIVINKFYLHNKSERKYFVSVQLPNHETIYKIKLSRQVKKLVDIGDLVLIVTLNDIIVIPADADNI